MRLAIVFLLITVLASAGSKEDTLKAELAAQTQRNEIAQAALLQASKDKAALAASIAKLTAATKAQTGAVAEQQATTTDKIAANAVLADQAATTQTAVAVQASAAASKAAEDAAAASKADAAAARSGSRNLIIVQGFSLLVVVVGFVYKGIEHKWEVAETVRKDKEAAAEIIRKEELAETRRLAEVAEFRENNRLQTAKLEQIHTLVNSNLTAALENELDARQVSLGLLREAVQAKRSAGFEPSPETLVLIATAEKKVLELGLALGEREKQTDLANKKMREDLAAKIGS